MATEDLDRALAEDSAFDALFELDVEITDDADRNRRGQPGDECGAPAQGRLNG